jgi:Flp pilus assembly protein TadD
VLASDPTDLEALSGAGAAALAVGDADAAINFYSRAERVAPRDGRIKAGLGSALIQKEQPAAALRLFGDAVDLGVPIASIALDRGLAYDLRGDSRRAQADYTVALRGNQNAEAARRLALSLAISGDKAGALAILDPLLRRQDIAAWRTRAFVLAMTGDVVGAEQAAIAVLPRYQADALRPFLGKIGALKASEKAAAVHFGHFPEDKAPVMASNGSAVASKGGAVVTAPIAPPPSSITASDGRTLFSATSPSSAKAGLATAKTTPAAATPATMITSTGGPDPAEQAAKADALREAAAKRAADRKAAAEKLAADRKAAAEKLAAEKKAQERADAKAAKSDPQRYWVQIASGSYKPDLDKEWDKQKGKFPKLLAGRTPWTMPFKATNRLLIGPFPSKSAAQDYVNTAREGGLSTFPVTSGPGQKVEKLN